MSLLRWRVRHGHAGRLGRSVLVTGLVALAASACSGGSANLAARPMTASTPVKATTTTVSAADAQLRSAAIASAETFCQTAVKQFAALPAVGSTSASVDTADHALARLVGSGSRLVAVKVPTPDQDVIHQLEVNLDQATRDVARSEQTASSGDIVHAVLAYNDAHDAVDHISSVLRHWGATCGNHREPGTFGLVEPTATIDVGAYADQVTADGDTVWVSLQDGRSVVRVDATDNKVVATIPVADDDLKTIQVTSDGVWVRGNDALHLIDPASNRVVRTIPKSAIGASVTRAFVDGQAIWACDGKQVVEASKQDGHPMATIPLPYACGTLASADKQVWVTSDAGQSGRISLIDPSTHALVRTTSIPADSGTYPSIASSAVWTNGEFGAQNPEAVGVDPSTGRVTQTAPMVGGGGPGALVGNDYYAVVTINGQVQAINLRTAAVDRTFDAGSEPNALSVSGHTLWVVDEGSGQLRRFEIG
jgi:hypothetical protein